MDRAGKGVMDDGGEMKRLGDAPLRRGRLRVGVRHYPRVFHHLAQGHAQHGLLHEKLSNEVLRAITHGGVRGELQVYRCDALVRVVVAWSLKRRVPEQELVTEDAKAPDVHSIVVRLSGQHLRGQVVQGPTQSLPATVGRVNGPAKVGNLQFAPHAKQKIFRLDVAMNHVLAVAVLQCTGQRRNVGCCPPLVKPLLPRELLVQFSARSVLQDEVHTRLIVKIAMEA